MLREHSKGNVTLVSFELRLFSGHRSQCTIVKPVYSFAKDSLGWRRFISACTLLSPYCLAQWKTVSINSNSNLTIFNSMNLLLCTRVSHTQCTLANRNTLGIGRFLSKLDRIQHLDILYVLSLGIIIFSLLGYAHKNTFIKNDILSTSYDIHICFMKHARVQKVFLKILYVISKLKNQNKLYKDIQKQFQMRLVYCD